MRIYFSLISALLVFPFISMAAIESVTLEQKSIFASRVTVDAIDSAVPRVVDVATPFSDGQSQTHLVVDHATNLPQPSIIKTRTTGGVLNTTLTDSFGTPSIASGNDENYETYVEFPFSETDADKNVVTININTPRAVVTTSVDIQLDQHIVSPRTVRVASIDENRQERVVLAQKRWTGNTIVFPEVRTQHLRITLTYTKPLRINEITIREKDAPRVTEHFVRFLAQPDATYDVYFDTKESLNITKPEQPNFVTDDQIVLRSAKQPNALYKKDDRDEDGVVDAKDNCISVSNGDQKDIDSNGTGDACEDFDRDGVMNDKDNCPRDTNRGQRDQDGDGLGDVCDAEESRLFAQYPWLPSAMILIVALVTLTLIFSVVRKK